MSNPIRRIARAAAGREIAQRVTDQAELLRQTQVILALAIEKLGGELVVTEHQALAMGSAGAQLTAEPVEGEPGAMSYRVRRVVTA